MTRLVRGSALAMMFFGLLPACGGGSADDDDDDVEVDASGGGDTDSGPGDDTDGGAPGEWQTLLRGDWNLVAGDEGYFCVVETLDRDIDIKAFRPIRPLGTHHTVLTTYEGDRADGTAPCDASANGQNMIYGSGVGSPDFAFPEGVGLRLSAGTRLLLNLHLYNASESPLSGESGTLFQEAAPGEIVHEAEVVLAGPTFTLFVPSGTTTQSGNCQMSNVTDEPIQVFAISQHMHKLGRHMRSVVTRGDQEIELQDIDYDFEVQVFQYVAPTIELRPGDVLTTYCTYENTAETNPPNGGPVSFGDSSDDEMCFTDIFYYPAQGATFICTGL